MSGYHIRPASPLDWEYIGKRLGQTIPQGAQAVMVFTDSWDVAGAFMFYNWTHNSVEGSWIINKKMMFRRGVGEFLMDYVFRKQKRKMVIGRITSTNKKSIKLAQHLGAELMGVIPDGHKDGVDLRYYVMKEENMPWTIPAKEEAA